MKMNINTQYTVTFTITNPAINNEATAVTVAMSTTNLLQTGQTINFNMVEINQNGVLFPYTALLGVTNGTNALKTVIPFEVRDADDVIDTPGAPNAITFSIQSHIAFQTGNTVTISGFQLPDGVYALNNVANNATLVWGTAATMTSGKLLFTVASLMNEWIVYALAINFLVSPPNSVALF
jgi:hypothetical protein